MVPSCRLLGHRHPTKPGDSSVHTKTAFQDPLCADAVLGAGVFVAAHLTSKIPAPLGLKSYREIRTMKSHTKKPTSDTAKHLRNARQVGETESDRSSGKATLGSWPWR